MEQSPSFTIDDLVRPNIRSLQPYHSARSAYTNGVLLDANENSLDAPFPEAEGLNRYPSPDQKALRQRIARWRNVSAENVFVGNGSDEAIDLLFRIFCEPGGDNIIITPPTYGMYKVSASIHNIGIKEVLLDENFQPQVEEILQQADKQTKLLFLCSPNNPTANNLDPSKTDALINAFPGIVVVDEAYIDFSNQPNKVSALSQYPNLVVLQTMSKSFGLAGIRLGMAFANPAVINYMMKVKAPYNINALTSACALEAFNHLDTITFKLDKIKEERHRLRNKLSQLPDVRHIYESDANFLLVKIDNALEVYQQLADRGIIVRYRGNEPGCKDCLRITAGTPDETDTLIETLIDLTA